MNIARIIGARVHNGRGDIIGIIHDIIITRDGTGPQAVLAGDNTTCIGDRQLVVPYDTIKVSADNRVTNTTSCMCTRNDAPCLMCAE